MKKLSLVLLGLFALAVTAVGLYLILYPAYRELPAYNVLLQEDEFPLGGVDESHWALLGPGNRRIPNAWIAFEEILQLRQADAVFKDLLKNASIGGRLFALCGLYFTDPGGLAEAAAHFPGRDEEVACPGSSGAVLVPAREIIESTSRGTDLVLSSHGLVSADVMDIVSGGIPIYLKEWRNAEKEMWEAEGNHRDHGKPLEAWLKANAEYLAQSFVTEELGEEGIRELTRLLRGSEGEVRRLAAEALGHVHEGFEIAIPALANALAVALADDVPNDDDLFLSEVVRSLHRMGAWSRDALPQIKEAIEDSHGPTSYIDGTLELLISTLGRMGQTAVPALTELLEHRSADVREMTAGVLQRLRSASSLGSL